MVLLSFARVLGLDDWRFLRLSTTVSIFPLETLGRETFLSETVAREAVREHLMPFDLRCLIRGSKPQSLEIRWNVAPGIIYISQPAARHASDDELAQLIAHAIGHDLLAHPVERNDVSDSRLAAELTTIAVVPGGILLGGIIDGMTRSSDYTLSQEIEAERIGLRIWLRSGRSCGTWISLRQGQKERGATWHEPIKDVAPPLDDLAALAERECGRKLSGP